MKEQLEKASALLRREAQILRESNPDRPESGWRGGEWSGNLDAKYDHDELLAAAEIVDKAIERLESQSRTVADLEALARANDDEIELKRLCIAGMGCQGSEV